MAAASCSSLSLALGEPLAATASQASAWLLIEQPGAWGRQALLESRLDPVIGGEVARRAKELGIKALLVKRPGRDGRTDGRRAVMLGRSDQAGAWLEQTTFESDRELLELDLERLGAGEAGHGEPVSSPVYLVCTNGRRDACCASLGRPVAAALAQARPGRVWECSHVGGHRFAANVVCLPDGLLLGRVEPPDAEAIAARYESGHVPLAHFRGRSSFLPAAQAADVLVRAREGLDRLDDLALLDLVTHDGSAVVALAHGAAVLRAHLRTERSGPPRPFSCGDSDLETPLVWKLVRLDREA